MAMPLSALIPAPVKTSMWEASARRVRAVSMVEETVIGPTVPAGRGQGAVLTPISAFRSDAAVKALVAVRVGW